MNAAGGAAEPEILAALLDSAESYLQSAARMNRSTPLGALLRQSRHLEVLELTEVCLSPALALRTTLAVSLLQFLLNQDDEGVAASLAGNPHVPMRVLREIGQRGGTVRERARVTAWQVHGECL